MFWSTSKNNHNPLEMCILNRLYTSCPAACLQCSSEGYSVRFIHSTPANVGPLLRGKKDFSLVSECNRCGERKSEAPGCNPNQSEQLFISLLPKIQRRWKSASEKYIYNL
ncbi:hypothetical protein CHARACLAT_011294 [Characodon lateralis]|uniref:Uncharacterized protein n=1 Tax=Characodon lateralis TaxID=208331 RepID=A0ABU7DQN7_9TELE|nr:hypothetical protein [Characodon lateralis]